MVTVKIDDVEVQVEPNVTILEAAEQAGVHIPVLCHHKMLNPFGACRVCLVEVKNNPKLMTACTTPVVDKMEVITSNEKLNKIRKTLIELLLINHPLDCPVCDKGGDCTLQDLTFEFGLTKVRFDVKPNDTPFDHTNPFIERDIDRCVLCGKCVRICDEVVNIQAIGFLNRGTDTIIGTSFEQPWNCEFCGQCMSVCPVGSLNNRVYLFKNRPWNLEKTYSTCGFCSCGCTVVVEHEGNEVFKISEDTDAGVNKGLLCAKGRFGFELINSTKRGKTPKVNINGELKDASYEDAVKSSVDKLKEIIATYGADAVGAVVSPRLTNEEAFAAQKLMRDVIGSNNIYSFESTDFLPNGTYDDVSASDNILVLNIDVTESNPILGLFIRMAARANGADLTVCYPKSTALKRVAKTFIKGDIAELYKKVELLISAAKGSANEMSDIANKLKSAAKPVLVFDPYNEFDASAVKELKACIPSLTLVPCKAKNNSQGILDMGCANGIMPGLVEGKKGISLRSGLESDKLKALLVFGENLSIKAEYSDLLPAIKKLKLVVVTDPFLSDTASNSSVYFPVRLFAEKDGSFTNIEGRVQEISKAVNKELPSDLEVISSIAKGLGGTISTDVDDVRKLIKEVSLYSNVDFAGGVVSYPYSISSNAATSTLKISGEGKYTLYPSSLRLHSGSFTKWSPDLGKAYGEATIEINPDDAKELNVVDGDYVALKIGDVTRKLKIATDKYIEAKTISLPCDYAETADIFHKGKYLKVDLVKHNA